MAGKHGGYREGGGRKPGSKGKRTLAVEETIREMGCPFASMHRVAKKAEDTGDLATAGRLYAELGRYVAPQRKAVDPDENRDKPRGLGLTLDELQKLKGMIVDGNSGISKILDNATPDETPDKLKVN